MRLTKNLLAVGLLALLALPSWGDVTDVRSAILASAFDLDGEAADADQVVASATLADSTSYTVAANPDVCRLVDVTITDADSGISAGVLTVVGTDCWGYWLTATFTFASGGSGVKTLIPAAAAGNANLASAAYFKTVTSVSNGLLTGEGAGDALTVGYTSNSEYGYPLYGAREESPAPPYRRVNIFGSYQVGQLIKNNTTTTLIAVSPATDAPFADVSVGDLLVLRHLNGAAGPVVLRRVTVKTDNDNVTINAAASLSTSGQGFSFKKFYLSTDPQDGWISMGGGLQAVSFMVDVNANASTGGVVSSIECAIFGGLFGDYTNTNQVDTDTVASGAAGNNVTSINLSQLPHFTHCRAGIKFVTGDDSDTANEDISLAYGYVR